MIPAERFRAACAALFIAAGLVLPVAASAQQSRRPAEMSVIERASQSRAKGKEGAPVLVYEIADFQCPYCGRFARDVYPKIDSAYVQTGKVQWVFVNMPLPNHGRAWLAAEAASCAGASGRFWPMHDRLFANPSEWVGAADPAAVFAGYAREAGVPLPAWQACIAGDQTAALIVQDLLFAGQTGASGTPAFVVNKQQLVVGMKSFEEWQGIIEQAMQPKD